MSEVHGGDKNGAVRFVATPAARLSMCCGGAHAPWRITRAGHKLVDQYPGTNLSEFGFSIAIPSIEFGIFLVLTLELGEFVTGIFSVRQGFAREHIRQSAKEGNRWCLPYSLGASFSIADALHGR